jgi:hypothetical protein
MLRKDEALDESCCVVRIRASRKGMRVRPGGAASH